MKLLQFLERDPTKRLGCKQNGPAESFEDLKRHPWFSSIDWVTLDTKEQTAPFIPDVCLLSLIVLMVTHTPSRLLEKDGEFRGAARIGGGARGRQSAESETAEGTR